MARAFDNGHTYAESKTDAIARARQVLADVASSCTGTTFTIVGYSQRVDAAGDIVSDTGHRKEPGEASHVLAVGLPADPGAGTQGTAIVGPRTSGRRIADPQLQGMGVLSSYRYGADHIGVAPATVSLIFGVAAAVDVALASPSGVLMDRCGGRVTAVPALLLFGTAFLILPLSQQLWWLVVVAVVLGTANGMSNDLVMTLGADVSPPHARAEFLAAWRLTHDTGSFAGPLVVGAVATVSLAGGATAIGALALVGAGVMYRYIPRYVPVSVAVPQDQRAAP